jgi:hypothetical protein
VVCSKTHQRVHLDITAASVPSGNNNRYVLSFTDPISKYAELVAIPDRTQKMVAKQCLSNGVVDMECQLKSSTIKNNNFVINWLQNCSDYWNSARHRSQNTKILFSRTYVH